MSFIVPADEGPVICTVSHFRYFLLYHYFLIICLISIQFFSLCHSSFYSFILFCPVSDLLTYSPYFIKKDKLVISVHI